MNRLRAGAAIAASVILSVTMLASCQTTSGERPPLRGGSASALDQPVGDRLRQTIATYAYEPDQCREALRDAGVRATRLPDETSRAGCALTNASLYQGSDYPYSAAGRVSCPMAVALTVWERQIVGPTAARYFRSPVAKIELIGSYSCRTRNSRPGAPMSEHATGNAADIAGFVLKDGTRINVERDWNTTSAESAFLQELRSRSCELFNAVLSPDYNYAHRDHLHFDLGRDRLCR